MPKIKITSTEINARITDAGFVFSGQCACPGRIRKYINPGGAMIKHHQTAKFVRLLYPAGHSILTESYEHFQKIISKANELEYRKTRTS